MRVHWRSHEEPRNNKRFAKIQSDEKRSQTLGAYGTHLEEGNTLYQQLFLKSN